MNNTTPDAGTDEPDTGLDELESSDPADAPQIAEDLADRLAAELDGSAPQRTPASEEPS